MGVRSVLNKAYLREEHDPGWVQLLKFHYGALALAEYAGAVAELRMARFGRDSAWRTMATLGALDEIRHTQIPLLFGHDLLRLDGNFDWTHRAYHTRHWVIVAARHLFDDMALAADAIDVAVQLNFVFETGFSNLQFLAMAAMADGADDHLFEKALSSIQTDEARHAQIGYPVLRTLIDNGGKERVQYLVEKMWWRCWRLMIILTGTAMEYLTPVGARIRSFRQFMDEWVIDQFMINLAEFGLERPWFWDLFVEELDFAHHSLQLGLYAYRTTLWFDVAAPDQDERLWLASTYPLWEETFGRLWDDVERNWQTKGEAGTLAYALPALCNLCQLPTVFVRPGHNTACTAEAKGRRYLFCSEPCRWIFLCEIDRFGGHESVVDRIVAGTAPGKLTDLHRWMGLDVPVELGKDLPRGLNPWRLESIPQA
jgi:toluene monooxygenase system protein A